jgi:hypothetical protein
MVFTENRVKTRTDRFCRFLVKTAGFLNHGTQAKTAGFFKHVALEFSIV